MDFKPLPPIDRDAITSEFTQRAQASVLGSAAGDALGAPFEFEEPGLYSRSFADPVIGGIGEMQGGGPWRPAEFTDDTQMALVQAESLLDRGGLDEEDLFGRFRAWADGSKDVGIQTRRVLRSDLIGSAAAEADYLAGNRAAGNGTIMRAAPTAVLLAAADEADTIDFARATAAVTHGDPATGWGSAIVHVVIRAALRGEDPWRTLDRILDELPDDQAL